MAKRILKNIRKNGDEYEVGNIKTYTITEDITTVTTEATAGVSPYDTSYGYTNITIDENSGIKWKEGAVYSFVVNTEMVVDSAKRNVRVRIGSSGSWIPVMDGAGTILNGNEFMKKSGVLLFVYKTTYQSTGALHMDTTISGKQDTISDLATIRTGAGKGATAIQPGDNISTLTNNSGYITKAVNDLTNYYTKSETYTKSEVADYVANFAGFKVVSTLPTTDIKTTIIYLLGPIGSGADKYEEWIYSNNAWVKIGETTVDLTNYFNKTTDDTDDITEGNNKFVTTSEKNTWNAKQNALATQTAYSAKGSATKVPQITTNNLGQVTGITEVTITQPTVNNSTITYTQAGDTITTTTTNQSSASTVALRGDIFVTQAQYNNLPSTKTTDGNTYIIYKT